MLDPTRYTSQKDINNKVQMSVNRRENEKCKETTSVGL